MSIFEAMMLICFGAAWPVSIYKTITSRSNSGKSLGFMVIVFIGYMAGVTHKLLFSFDLIIYLYILNALMVLTDIMFYYRNSRYLYNKK